MHLKHSFIVPLMILGIAIPAWAGNPCEKLKTINTGNGINLSEAEAIVTCYFEKNVGCGAAGDIKDEGTYWDVSVKFGYAGEPRPFHIDKKTGAVTTDIGPNYLNPMDLLK
jgi:hypothetical protein